MICRNNNLHNTAKGWKRDYVNWMISADGRLKRSLLVLNILDSDTFILYTWFLPKSIFTTDIYLTGASNKTTIKAIKIVAIYNKIPRANQVSRFELLTTLILYFLCFIALTICIHLADYSIDHQDEKGTTSSGWLS